MSARPLLLHISALSPAEYRSFTASLAELSGDTTPDHASSEYWEAKSVSVLEAKGWLRGRYGLDAAVVDKILRFFRPSLVQSDILSAGQFFGVLRLVSHVQAGKDPTEDLIFVQANPSNDPSKDRRSPSPRRPPIESKVPADAESNISLPPDSLSTPSKFPPPASRARQFPSDPFPSPSPELDKDKPAKPAAPSPLSANPFRRSVSSQGIIATPISLPPFPPALSSTAVPSTARITSPSPPPPPHPLSRSTSAFPPTPKPAGNPFVNRTPNPLPSTPASPPLPPRKPPLPPRSDSSIYLSSFQSQPPPRHPVQLPKPPKPPSTTSPLIKQSLIAAKGAQALKASESTLEKTRMLEVIGRSGSKDRERIKDKSEKEREAQGQLPLPVNQASWARNNNPITSSPSSTSSLELVASTRLDQQAEDGRHSNSGASSDERPPERHLHIIPTSSLADLSDPMPITSPRTSRSKSMHSPVPPQPPLPPPPRRRPESVQIISPSFSTLTPTKPSPHPKFFTFDDGITPTTLSRHTSLSSSSRRVSVSTSASSAASAPDALQNLYTSVKKRAETFQPQFQDGLETVRLKAEGKLVPGGFARRGAEGERLVDSQEEDDENENDDGAGIDDGNEDGEWKEWDRTNGDEGTKKGEGWKRLGG